MVKEGSSEEAAFDHRFKRGTRVYPGHVQVRGGDVHVMYKPRTGKAGIASSFIVCAARPYIR